MLQILRQNDAEAASFHSPLLDKFGTKFRLRARQVCRFSRVRHDIKEPEVTLVEWALAIYQLEVSPPQEGMPGMINRSQVVIVVYRIDIAG